MRRDYGWGEVEAIVNGLVGTARPGQVFSVCAMA